MFARGPNEKRKYLAVGAPCALALGLASSAVATTAEGQGCMVMAQPPVVRTDVKRIGDENKVNDTLKVRGEADLPAEVHFDSISPIDHGATVAAVDNTGATLFTIYLPPGMYRSELGIGWIPNGAKTRWRFRANAETAPNGIRSLRIDDRSGVSPGRLRVVVEGRNGSYLVAPGQEPVTIRVALDNESGLCVETAFLPGDCVFSPWGGALRCRQ